MIISAVFVILFSFAVCASVPTVQTNVFWSSQVALYTIAAGVSAVYQPSISLLLSSSNMPVLKKTTIVA